MLFAYMRTQLVCVLKAHVCGVRPMGQQEVDGELS